MIERRSRPVFALVVLVLLLAAASPASAQSFTYQGRLADNGVPATGAYNFQFTFWTAVSGGTQVGSTLIFSGLPVTNGLFTVDLALTFPGADRWIEITVWKNAQAPVLLAPRQKIMPSPYALALVPGASMSSSTTDRLISATASGDVGGVIGDAAPIYGQLGFGNASWGSPGNAAVRGDSADQTGVMGTTTAGYGTQGIASTGVGVGGYSGFNPVALPAGTGVYGRTSIAGFGVKGDNGVTGAHGELGGNNFGVQGTATSGVGVVAVATSGTALNATSSSGVAVNATTAAGGTTSAVYAYNTGGGRGLWAYSPGGYGVEGQSNTSYGVYGYSSSSYAGYFDGSVYVGGSFVNPSDARLKADVAAIPYGLPEIMRLRPVSWHWADGHAAGPKFGVIAQELEGVLPELVARDCDPDKPLAVDYVGLVPVVIRALQEEVRSKDDAIRALEKRLEALEERVSASPR